MKAIIAASLCAVLFVGGCASNTGSTRTYEKFAHTMNGFMGNREAVLIAIKGPPDRYFESGESRYLTYDTTFTQVIPGRAPTYYGTVSGNSVKVEQYGGSPDTVQTDTCSVTFEVIDSVVRRWTSRGNDCKY